MNFGEALNALKEGAKVARNNWNGKDMWVALEYPDETSKMKRPFLYMAPIDGEFVPWVASQTDLLAEDWHTV